MTFEEYQECKMLLDAHYESVLEGCENQGTFGRAKWAAKKLYLDFTTESVDIKQGES